MNQEQQPQDQEPEDFLAFAKRGFDNLRKQWNDLKIGQMEGQLTPHAQLLAWDDEAQCAEELRAFLKSPFWLNRLEPWCRSRSTIQPWRGAGLATLEQATTEYVRASGKAEAFLEMLSEFREWERKGVEGARRLKLEREKNAEIEKRRQQLAGV